MLLALWIGRSISQADATTRLKLGVGVKVCQCARSLYSGMTDNQKAHNAALRVRAASLRKLEKGAAVMAGHLDTPTAKKSLKSLRFRPVAKAEEQRLEEQLPSALSTHEAENVERCSRARAVLDVIRQQCHNAVDDAGTLHRLARRFVAESSEEASLVETRIQKKNKGLAGLLTVRARHSN